MSMSVRLSRLLSVCLLPKVGLLLGIHRQTLTVLYSYSRCRSMLGRYLGQVEIERKAS